MRELYIKISPIILNYSGAIVENNQLVTELTSIPAQPFDLAQFILENNIEKVRLHGNIKYTSGVKNLLTREFNKITQYNVPIEIILEEISG